MGELGQEVLAFATSEDKPIKGGVYNDPGEKRITAGFTGFIYNNHHRRVAIYGVWLANVR